MKRMTVVLLSLALGSGGVSVLGAAQDGSPASRTDRLAPGRQYQEGERLSYRMTGTNRHGDRTSSYEATASGIVKRDSMGRFVEEYEWSDLILDGADVDLSSAGREVSQLLSLSPDYTLSVPDLSQVHPELIGPITDLLTFYADAWLAFGQQNLAVPGDRVVIPHGEANSWADGTYVLMGEDAVDFVISVESVDEPERTALLTVRHVPPAGRAITIPADWMEAPVAETPNNWVQVIRSREGGYVASVGNETFDVELEISLTNGRILSARMDNVVDVLERICVDEALEVCEDPTRYQIVREIALTEIRANGAARRPRRSPG